MAHAPGKAPTNKQVQTMLVILVNGVMRGTHAGKVTAVVSSGRGCHGDLNNSGVWDNATAWLP